MRNYNKSDILVNLFKQGLLLLCLAFFSSCANSPELKEEVKPSLKPKAKIFNRSLYQVGPKVITAIDLNNMKKQLRSQGQKRNLSKKAKDALITRAIVNIEGEENNIIISKKRLENEIGKRSAQQGLSKRKFTKKIERETGISFSDWINELRYRLVRRQLVQLSLEIKPATLAELKKFYRKNKKRIGIEIKFREIVFVPKNNNFAEESRISNLAKDVHFRLTNNPKSFANLAKTIPDNKSYYKKRGGLRPYQSIYDIAAKNKILAGLLFNMPKGAISRPFRDSLKRYLIVKLESKRPIAFRKVKHLILARVYAEKEETAFKKWITRKKKEIIVSSIPKS